MKVLIWVPDDCLDSLIKRVCELQYMEFEGETVHSKIFFSKVQLEGCLNVEIEWNDYVALKDNNILVEIEQ
jgi:hypothetical protein